MYRKVRVLISVLSFLLVLSLAFFPYAFAGETPKYGGTLNLHSHTTNLGFDEAYTIPWYCRTNQFTNEELCEGDWTKGPAGTNENSFLTYAYSLKTLAGCLAESWEIPDNETIIYHIRRGVHWHNKPPVNGRELVADDIVYNIKRIFSSEHSRLYSDHREGERPKSVTATDKYTVVIKVPPKVQGPLFRDIGSMLRIFPPEMIEKYGDMKDWKNSCGTGPFELIEYVPKSSFTLKRNANYWMKDPFNKQNQLPYVDKVKEYFIKDKVSVLAALRTGKIDETSEIDWEKIKPLKRSNPKLGWASVPYYSTEVIGMRSDTKPYDDIRVRRALALAINNKEIKDAYFGGHAELFNFPVTNEPALKDCIPDFDKLPETTRELYEYHPEKAKKLLAEAGYPNGFKTEIICRQKHQDVMLMIKEYWKNIGVDLDLNIKDWGTYSSMEVAKSHKHMFLVRGSTSSPFQMITFRTGASRNTSMVSDPWLDKKYIEISENFFDLDKRSKILREEVVPYVLDKCWYIQPPERIFYFAWQPWLKNFYGCYSVGYLEFGNIAKYAWLDLDLKEKMIGKR